VVANTQKAKVRTKMKFVNLTPHEINPIGGDSIAPSGDVARVSTRNIEVLPGFFAQETGEVQGLPGAQEGVLFIVSAMVRLAVPERGDVVSPGELVRNEQGQPVGCRGFFVNPGFKA
jgi:hypothetical protein